MIESFCIYPPIDKDLEDIEISGKKFYIKRSFEKRDNYTFCNVKYWLRDNSESRIFDLLNADIKKMDTDLVGSGYWLINEGNGSVLLNFPNSTEPFADNGINNLLLRLVEDTRFQIITSTMPYISSGLDEKIKEIKDYSSAVIITIRTKSLDNDFVFTKTHNNHLNNHLLKVLSNEGLRGSIVNLPDEGKLTIKSSFDERMIKALKEFTNYV